MPKDAAARKQIQLLKAELSKARDIITRSSVLVFKQAAVTTLLIEKGIITNGEIESRVKTLLHANSENPVRLSDQSEGSGTAEDHSRCGESGLLSDESVGDDSGNVASGSDPQDQESETSDQPVSTGSGDSGKPTTSED